MALVGCGKIGGGALASVLMRRFRFCERGVECRSFGNDLSHLGTEFCFAAAKLLGGGGRV